MRNTDLGENVATVTDQVRALIPDTGNPQVFTDTELGVYIDLAQDSPYIAAALALEAVATNDIMTYRILRTDDLAIDGVAGSKVLLDRARRLREQGGDFDYFEIVYPGQSGVWAPEATANPWL